MTPDPVRRFFSHFDNRRELQLQRHGQRFVGLLGESPSKGVAQNAAWNHLLNVLDLDVAYVPLDLGSSRRDSREALERIIGDGEATAELIGFKVAPPYKQHVFEILARSADGAARRLSSANTVAKRNGRMFCWNTDGLGMCLNLAEAFGPVEGKTYLILGAGRAASSISDALVERAGQILVATRELARALELKRWLGRHHSDAAVDTLLITDVRKVVSEVDCVINTTPVGREGQFEAFSSLVSTDMSSEKNTLLSEEIIGGLTRPVCFASTLYRPERELLLRQAERHSHPVVNGLGMWLYQAAVAAQDAFFPEALSGVPVSRLAEVLGQGLSVGGARGPAHGC
jgi:shikimate dehydrogenase